MEGSPLLSDLDSDDSGHGSETVNMAMSRHRLQEASRYSLRSAQCNIETQSHYREDHQIQGLDLGDTFHGKNMISHKTMDTVRKKETNLEVEARAVRVCDEFKEIYQVQSWPGYKDKEIVIVAFLKNLQSNSRLPPKDFKSFQVILRTDDDNSICKTASPRVSKEDVKHCKPIIAKFGPELIEEHSNMSMIIVSSYRLKNGAMLPRVCIAIYCRGKGVIPFQEKPFPSSLDGVAVDVREGYCSFGMRNSQLQGGKEYHNNLRTGVEIARSGGPGGTLGGFLRKPSGDICFLTCAHVLIPNRCLNRSFPGFTFLNDCWQHCNSIDVFQPAYHTGPPIGRVENAIFEHSNPGVTSVDAALVPIKDARRLPIDPYMTKQPLNKRNLRSAGFSDSNPPKYSSGAIIPQMDEPCIGHMVIKCGATTGLTHGVLAMDGGIFRMENQELHLPGILGQQSPRIVMYHQYLIEFLENNPFFQMGDSGSFVFMQDEGDLKCIGMAIGDTTHGGCIVTPIEAILDSLGIGNDGNTSPFLPFDSGDDSDGDDESNSDGGDSDHPDAGPSRRKRKTYPRRENRRGKRPSLHHEQMDHQQSYVHYRRHGTSIKVLGDGHVFQQVDGKKITQILPVAALGVASLMNNPESVSSDKKDPNVYPYKNFILRCIFPSILIGITNAVFGTEQYLSFPSTYNALNYNVYASASVNNADYVKEIKKAMSTTNDNKSQSHNMATFHKKSYD